jgi:hypothetical protein
MLDPMAFCHVPLPEALKVATGPKKSVPLTATTTETKWRWVDDLEAGRVEEVCGADELRLRRAAVPPGEGLVGKCQLADERIGVARCLIDAVEDHAVDVGADLERCHALLAKPASSAARKSFFMVTPLKPGSARSQHRCKRNAPSHKNIGLKFARYDCKERRQRQE